MLYKNMLVRLGRPLSSATLAPTIPITDSALPTTVNHSGFSPPMCRNSTMNLPTNTPSRSSSDSNDRVWIAIQGLTTQLNDIQQNQIHTGAIQNGIRLQVNDLSTRIPQQSDDRFNQLHTQILELNENWKQQFTEMSRRIQDLSQSIVQPPNHNIFPIINESHTILCPYPFRHLIR